MSKEVNVNVSFQNEFKGQLVSSSGNTIDIGQEAIRPYDMLLGALVGCFHHTLLEIVGKKRQTVEAVDYQVYGRKRDEVPSTLEYVRLDITVTGAKDAVQINKSIELSKKYCSVFQTISHVANIEVTVTHQ